MSEKSPETPVATLARLRREFIGASNDLEYADAAQRIRKCVLDHAERIAAERAALVALLADLEWSDHTVIDGTYASLCPECSGMRQDVYDDLGRLATAHERRGHYDDCRLAALLGGGGQ